MDGVFCAWNEVRLAGLSVKEKQQVPKEIKLLKDLQHPMIIPLKAVWVKRETEEIVFITELMTAGSLKSFISRVKLIRWKVVKGWAKQILGGLKYLHGFDPPVIHRDLKCDNVSAARV